MIAELEQAVAWLESFGIAIRTKRHAIYLRYLKLIDKRWREAGNMRAADVPIDPKRMETAAFEAAQLIRIWQAFAESPPDGLDAKLKIYAGGPELEREERPSKSGNSARDCGFELDVAVHFRAAGPINLTEGVDVVVRFQTMPIFIECKRPSSQQMVAENLDRATDAIMLQLNHTALSSYGMPAISIAKVEWVGGVVLQGNSAAALENALTSWMARFDKDYIQPWFPTLRDGRLIAVLLHIPYVGYIGDSPSIVGVQLGLIGSRFVQGTIAHRDLAKLTEIVRRANH